MAEENTSMQRMAGIDAIAEMVVVEDGDTKLNGRIEIISNCELCSKPLANPAIVMTNDADERDSAIIGKCCQD